MIIRSYTSSDDIEATIEDFRFLERLNRTGRIRDLQITGGKCRFRATQFCGTVALTNEVIEIIPVVEDGITLPSLLYQMLNRIFRTELYTPKLDISGESSLTESAKLVDVVAALLCARVNSLARHGLYRDYDATRGVERYLRGRLQLIDQLRSHGLGTEFHCLYDEYTENNPQNQVLASTLRRLLSAVSSPKIRRDVSRNLLIFSDVDLAPVDEDTLDNLYYTRLTRHYRPMHNLCRLILRGIAVEGPRGETKATSFLVDLNRIFEAFIAAILTEALKGEGFTVQYQSKTELMTPENHKYGLPIRPDLVITSNGFRKQGLVLDAKFKKVFTENLYGGKALRNPDFYQIFSYASKFKTYGLLVYPGKPENIEGRIPLEWRSDGAESATVGLGLLNLNVPSERLGQDIVTTVKEKLRIGLS
jgi:5-methylcytosine-specific restriction enzyme subunit McrC